MNAVASCMKLTTADKCQILTVYFSSTGHTGVQTARRCWSGWIVQFNCSFHSHHSFSFGSVVWWRRSYHYTLGCFLRHLIALGLVVSVAINLGLGVFIWRRWCGNGRMDCVVCVWSRIEAQKIVSGAAEKKQVGIQFILAVQNSLFSVR